jgi:hypothetical protein
MSKKRSSKDYEKGSIAEAQAYYRSIGIQDGNRPIDPKEIERFNKARAERQLQSKTYYNEEGGDTSEVQETNSGDITRPFLKPNVLHKYASYTTLFTLSGVTEQELRTHKFLKTPVHDVIARSGGIGDPNVTTREFKETNQDYRTVEREADKTRYAEKYTDSINILKRGHDLFFENVNIISTASPNAERNLGNFTRMQFELQEPYSISFIEKLRAAAAINGYDDYQDAPFLLTIEFKGFDEQGRPYAYHSSNKSTVRKIPILISRVEFDVNEAGARYQVIAVPYADLAYDDRYKYPRIDVPTTGTDAQDWVYDVVQSLKDQMTQEIKEKVRTYPDTYEFIIDDAVKKFGQKYKDEKPSANLTGRVASYEDQLAAEVETINPPVRKKTMEGSANANVALTKYFEDAIRSSFGYQKLADNFWVTYLRAAGVSESKLQDQESVSTIIRSADMRDIIMDNQYVDWFKIKTTIETDTSRIDPITKMHPKNIIYQAIPYKIHVLKLIAPGVSLKNVDWSRIVHKDYNYLYTGDNIDVQNLRINYKAAFYQRNVIGRGEKSNAEKGYFSWVDELTQSIFGQERDPEPLLPLRQYPSTIKGPNTVNTSSAESLKAQQFYDYLTNPEADMMRIEMDILGDPAYIAQDMYTPIHDNRVTVPVSKGSFDSQMQSFNFEQFMPLINLRYRMPDDPDELEGTMFSADVKYREENLFFNGVYQLNKVESKFDNGQFTQTLFCTRMNNQQGEGLPPDLVSGAVKGINSAKALDVDELAKKKSDEAARKLKSENFGLGPFDG